MLNKAMLDEDPLLRGRPIALKRVDGHAAWVSPKVLDLMSPLPDSVSGGQVIRDEDGYPTGNASFQSVGVMIFPSMSLLGVFLDNAMDLIPYPPWTDAQHAVYFKTAMKDAISVGLTSIHDAFTPPEQVEFYKKYLFVLNN